VFLSLSQATAIYLLSKNMIENSLTISHRAVMVLFFCFSIEAARAHADNRCPNEQ